MESIRLTKEDFDEIYPFFSEMRRVDYEKYLTMTLKQIEIDFINAQNDPTLKAIMNFVDKVSDYLYINDILPARNVTLDQYVKVIEDFKESTSKPEKKIDHLGRKHNQDQEEMIDKVRKQRQEMRQERRKKILGENRKQEADAKTKAETEADIKLKEKKKEYIPYLRNEIRNGKEVNVKEQVEIIEHNKSLTKRMKDESIEFVKKMVVALQPYENQYRSLERLYKEQNIQFAQILRAGTQQLLNYRSEILKLESENEQLRIKLETKDREESDRIKQETKDLTSATNTIKILLETELKTKPKIKPASKNRLTVDNINKFLNTSFGEIKNLDTQLASDVWILEEVLKDIIELMRKKDTAVDQQTLDAFNAFKSNDDPSFIKDKLKNLIQSLIACNHFVESEIEKAEEKSLRSVKERLRKLTQEPSENAQYSYSEELVNDISGSMIEDATSLTEFFDEIENVYSNITDDYYRNQYKKIIEKVLNYSTKKFDNEERELNILKNTYNSNIRSLLTRIIKETPKSADLEELDNRPRPQKETFEVKLREIISKSNMTYRDDIGELWYNAAKKYLISFKEFFDERDVLRFYKVLLRNKTLPRIFEDHLNEIIEDELNADMVLGELKKVLNEIIRDYEVTQEFENITKGKDELKQSEPTNTLEKDKDEPIEEKHSELAKKLLEYEGKRSSADEFVSKVGKKILSQKFIKGDESVIKQLKYSPLLDIFKVVDNRDKLMFKTNFEFVQSVLGKTQFEYYKYDSFENSTIYDALPA